VLGRDDDGGGRHRLAAFVAQGHLALGVGLEERRRAGMAVGGHALEDLVAVIERRRHQVGRFVGGIAEHDALVARAFVLVAARIDALRDVRRLAVQVVDRIRRFASGSRPARSRCASPCAHGASISSCAPGAHSPFS
jgi:dihydroxyacetone kinase